MEDSEKYDVFSAKDRSEFLFRVFLHITLGGPVNQVWKTSHSGLVNLYIYFHPTLQYEDEVKPYLVMSKLLYKKLLT